MRIGRATGDIDIHGDNLVDGAHTGIVLAENTTAAAACAHSDH
jgi:hypothetical protein